MFYTSLVKCNCCGHKQWKKMLEKVECCSKPMESTGVEQYDIDGAFLIAAIRRHQKDRKGAA